MTTPSTTPSPQTTSKLVLPGTPEASLAALADRRAEFAERFHLYQEVRALTRDDQEALFDILWEAQQGNPEVLEAIYSLVYDEIPVPMEEFILGSRYLNLRGLINKEKLDILCAFDEPHVRKAWVAAGSGGGKALALDTPIPTPTGWTQMGDLAVGDQVLDVFGRPCNVVALSEIETTVPCTRLEFGDGSSIVASDNHKWPVMPTRSRVDGRIHEWCLTAETRDLIPKTWVGCTVEGKVWLESLRREPSVPVRCIQVDAQSHMYQAGLNRAHTHNSFMVSIAMARQVYRLMCLKRPDMFYLLGPGSRIAIINLSVSKEQAREVIFSEFLARLQAAPWFHGKYRSWTAKAKFPKEVYAFSGGSTATSYYGYHTIFGSLDEASFLVDRSDRSVAEELSEALLKSLHTRFPGAYKLFVISTLRSVDDFLFTQLQRIKDEGVRVL